MNATFHIGRGRGSNPASRANLKPHPRTFFLYTQEPGGAWREVSGPWAFHVACRKEREAGPGFHATSKIPHALPRLSP